MHTLGPFIAMLPKLKKPLFSSQSDKPHWCYLVFEEPNGWKMKTARVKNNPDAPDINSTQLENRSAPLPEKLSILVSSNGKKTTSTSDKENYCFVFEAENLHAYKLIFNPLSTKCEGIRHAWTYAPNATYTSRSTPTITREDFIEYGSTLFPRKEKQTSIFDAWRKKAGSSLSDASQNILSARWQPNNKNTLKTDIDSLRDPKNYAEYQLLAQLYYAGNLVWLDKELQLLSILAAVHQSNTISAEQMTAVWALVESPETIDHLFDNFLEKDQIETFRAGIPPTKIPSLINYLSNDQKLRTLYDYGSCRTHSADLSAILETITDADMIAMINDDSKIQDKHRCIPAEARHSEEKSRQVLLAWTLVSLSPEKFTRVTQGLLSNASRQQVIEILSSLNAIKQCPSSFLQSKYPPHNTINQEDINAKINSTLKLAAQQLKLEIIDLIKLGQESGLEKIHIDNLYDNFFEKEANPLSSDSVLPETPNSNVLHTIHDHPNSKVSLSTDVTDAEVLVSENPITTHPKASGSDTFSAEIMPENNKNPHHSNNNNLPSQYQNLKKTPHLLYTCLSHDLRIAVDKATAHFKQLKTTQNYHHLAIVEKILTQAERIAIPATMNAQGYAELNQVLYSCQRAIYAPSDQKNLDQLAQLGKQFVAQPDQASQVLGVLLYSLTATLLVVGLLAAIPISGGSVLFALLIAIKLQAVAAVIASTTSTAIAATVAISTGTIIGAGTLYGGFFQPSRLDTLVEKLAHTVHDEKPPAVPQFH